MVINFTGKRILVKRQQKIGNGVEHVETVSILLVIRTHSHIDLIKISSCAVERVFSCLVLIR